MAISSLENRKNYQKNLNSLLKHLNWYKSWRVLKKSVKTKNCFPDSFSRSPFYHQSRQSPKQPSEGKNHPAWDQNRHRQRSRSIVTTYTASYGFLKLLLRFFTASTNSSAIDFSRDTTVKPRTHPRPSRPKNNGSSRAFDLPKAFDVADSLTPPEIQLKVRYVLEVGSVKMQHLFSCL